jgi:hypothetical protein
MVNTVQPTGEPIRERRYGSVRMAVTLTSVIFPLDFVDLTQALKKNQYDVGIDLPMAGIGHRVGGAGVIAKKGGISVVADSERRFIGIDGRSPKDVSSSFEELTQILKKELWVDVYAQSAFYEINMRLNVLAHTNPTKAITKFFENLEGIQALESIIGEKTSLFTIRLVPKDKLPSGNEWFDIRLEPDVSRPERAMAVEIVYRKTSYKDVRNFIDTADQKIEAILDRLEQKK